jgi:hypothetical protein
MRSTLLVLALALTACSGGGTPAAATPSAQGSTTPLARGSATPAHAGTPTPSPTAAPSGLASLHPDPRLATVQFAAGLAPDGTPQSPTTTFHAQSDRKIVAALKLNGVPPGTQLSFIRYLDGKFVDTRSATVAKPAAWFYFEFTAAPGKQFTVGHYMLRLYIDGHASAEAEYSVV